jgi:hypothetical protein
MDSACVDMGHMPTLLGSRTVDPNQSSAEFPPFEADGLKLTAIAVLVIVAASRVRQVVGLVLLVLSCNSAHMYLDMH